MPEPGPWVFVIEDDDMMRTALNSLLTAHGYGVRFAPSVERARLDPWFDEAACRIVDIRLPGASGLDFIAEQCRRDPALARRVIVITAHDSKEDRNRAMALGVRGYLRKPFEGAALAELIRAAIDDRAGPAVVSSAGTTR